MSRRQHRPGEGAAALLTAVLLLLPFMAGATRLQPGSSPPLMASQAYLSVQGGLQTALVPHFWFAGMPLASTLWGELSLCAAACANDPSCSYFNHCDAEEGCDDGHGQLSYLQCRLLVSNCTLLPPVAGRDASAAVPAGEETLKPWQAAHCHLESEATRQAASQPPPAGQPAPPAQHQQSPGAGTCTSARITAGFPIRTPPLEPPGYVARVAQGLSGADFTCAASTQPGSCAFDSVLDAVVACSHIAACRSVVVYTNGYDGCSPHQLAVLKTSSLQAANAFVAPSVYVLEAVDSEQMALEFLSAADAAVLVPSQLELNAATAAADASPAALSAGATPWLGCIVAQGALMAGDVTELLSGVKSAEACCRACRQRQGGRGSGCNVWNHCSRQGGCRFDNGQVSVSLRQGECELRKQALMEPKLGWPPVLISKGPLVSFTAGAPLSAAAPAVPGYSRVLGSSLWGQQGFECANSLRPDLGECVLGGPLEEAADSCSDDALCAAFVWKPTGLLPSHGGTAVLRSVLGADLNTSIFSPNSVLYLKAAIPFAPPPSPMLAGLPAGTMAGAAVGAAAGAAMVVAVAACCVALCWRRLYRGIAASIKKEAALASLLLSRPSPTSMTSPAARVLPAKAAAAAAEAQRAWQASVNGSVSSMTAEEFASGDRGGSGSGSSDQFESPDEFSEELSGADEGEQQQGTIHVSVGGSSRHASESGQYGGQDRSGDMVGGDMVRDGSVCSISSALAAELIQEGILTIAQLSGSEHSGGRGHGSKPGSRPSSKPGSKPGSRPGSRPGSKPGSKGNSKGNSKGSSEHSAGFGGSRTSKQSKGSSKLTQDPSFSSAAAGLTLAQQGLGQNQGISLGASSACQSDSAQAEQSYSGSVLLQRTTRPPLASGSGSVAMTPFTPTGLISPATSQRVEAWLQPAPPSPFAAQSRERLAFHGSSAMQSVGTSLGSRGNTTGGRPHSTDYWQTQADQSGEDFLEFMQNRAGQDSTSSGDNSAWVPTPQLVLASLPASLREWFVPRSSIEYLCNADGTPQSLGEGASGRVFKAILNGEVVAAKEMDVGSSLEAQRAFVTEAVRLMLLRHANVVAFYGCSLHKDRGLLLMEFCEGRDLHSVLQLQAAGTSQRLFGWHRRGKRVALEVARAMNYLHSKNVVHMDIKSGNVLLSASGTAKLADVGLSRLQNRTVMSDLSLMGTFAWAAPEVLMGGINCTKAVDMYSFGVLCYEITTGERPLRGNLRLPLVPEECPQEVVDLMLECLSSDPLVRPSAQQLMQRLAEMVSGRPSIDPQASFNTNTNTNTNSSRPPMSPS